MARTLNKVILIGHCGDDPQITDMQNGSKVANVSIATNTVWKDKVTNEKRERSEWHRVVFYNNLAQIVETYVKKGALIYVEGELRYARVEQPDKTFRYYTDIICRDLNILSGKNFREDMPANPSHSEIASANRFEQDDDLPF